MFVGTILVAVIAWFHGRELHAFEAALAQERADVDAAEKARVSWHKAWRAVNDAYDEGDIDMEDWQEQRDELLEQLP